MAAADWGGDYINGHVYLIDRWWSGSEPRSSSPTPKCPLRASCVSWVVVPLYGMAQPLSWEGCSGPSRASSSWTSSRSSRTLPGAEQLPTSFPKPWGDSLSLSLSPYNTSTRHKLHKPVNKWLQHWWTLVKMVSSWKLQCTIAANSVSCCERLFSVCYSSCCVQTCKPDSFLLVDVHLCLQLIGCRIWNWCSWWELKNPTFYSLLLEWVTWIRYSSWMTVR